MKEEVKFIGYSFMGNTDYFDEVYDSEEEAIKAAEEAYINGDTDKLGFGDPDEDVQSVVRILKVMEINKETLVENALLAALEYMDETYDDFEAGIDDGNIIREKNLFKEVLPVLARNIDFGGATQKGEVLYLYNLKDTKGK